MTEEQEEREIELAAAGFGFDGAHAAMLQIKQLCDEAEARRDRLEANAERGDLLAESRRARAEGRAAVMAAAYQAALAVQQSIFERWDEMEAEIATRSLADMDSDNA